MLSLSSNWPYIPSLPSHLHFHVKAHNACNPTALAVTDPLGQTHTCPHLALRRYESHSSWIQTLRLCSNWPLYPLVSSCLLLSREEEGRGTERPRHTNGYLGQSPGLIVFPVVCLDALVPLVAKISSCFTWRHTQVQPRPMAPLQYLASQGT